MGSASIRCLVLTLIHPPRKRWQGKAERVPGWRPTSVILKIEALPVTEKVALYHRLASMDPFPGCDYNFEDLGSVSREYHSNEYPSRSTIRPDR